MIEPQDDSWPSDLPPSLALRKKLSIVVKGAAGIAMEHAKKRALSYMEVENELDEGTWFETVLVCVWSEAREERARVWFGETTRADVPFPVGTCLIYSVNDWPVTEVIEESTSNV